MCFVATIALTDCRGQTRLATQSATDAPLPSPASATLLPSPDSTGVTTLDWTSRAFPGVVRAVAYRKRTWIAVGRVAKDPMAWISDDGKTLGITRRTDTGLAVVRAHTDCCHGVTTTHRDSDRIEVARKVAVGPNQEETSSVSDEQAVLTSRLCARVAHVLVHVDGTQRLP